MSQKEFVMIEDILDILHTGIMKMWQYNLVGALLGFILNNIYILIIQGCLSTNSCEASVISSAYMLKSYIVMYLNIMSCIAITCSVMNTYNNYLQHKPDIQINSKQYLMIIFTLSLLLVVFITALKTGLIAYVLNQFTWHVHTYILIWTSIMLNLPHKILAKHSAMNVPGAIFSYLIIKYMIFK